MVNGRLYPLAIFGGSGDFFIKPYAVAGLGSGAFKVDLGVWTYNFAINLGAGADFMLGDRFGLYGEVAHKFYTGDVPVLASADGVTDVNFGAIFKF
jgi:hypothetical protein